MKWCSENLKRLKTLSEKVRKEEIKARNFLIALEEQLDKLTDKTVIDDYNTWVELSVFSYDESICKKYETDLGDPIYEDRAYSFGCDNDEVFFEMNWNELENSDHPIAHFYLGYAMHCILFHSAIKIEDILKIDDVWIEIKVDYQFCTDKEN